MTENLEIYKCEICGEPATCGVRDIKERDNWRTGYVERKPHGPPHLFCAEHNRESRVTDMTLSPLAAVYRVVEDDDW